MDQNARGTYSNMNVLLADSQTIGETEATVFEMIQSSPVVALVTLSNNGTNTMNYRFQEKVGTTWSNLSALGTDLNNTLSAGQSKAVSVTSTYPQVKLLANATGGTSLEFGVLRYYDRAPGDPLPILSL